MALLPSGFGSVGGYQISRSLRFNSADSAYLNRTPAGAGNRQTWTWSGWVKRSKLGTTQTPFSAQRTAGTDGSGFFFTASDTLRFYAYNGTSYDFDYATTQVFRDVGSWYHLVFVLDTTNATSTDRVRIYVNGTRITAWGTSTAPSLNFSGYINQAIVHYIGKDDATSTGYPDAYFTEINFIDGQALTPSSFGVTDANTGIWSPKAYVGTYGTNGFYLNFSDNSGTTATTLGKDYSGNGNNWTPNNFSVTAGSGNDSLVDVPTSYGTDTGLGGQVRGNYATLNPLSNLGSTFTFTNGNLDCSLSSGDKAVPSTMLVSSGKWYCEMTITAVGTGGSSVGLIPTIYTASAQIGNSTDSYAYRSSGNKRTNSTDSAYGASYTTNDVIGIALDLDAGTLVFYKNGATQGTAFSSISGTFAFAFSSTSSSSTTSVTANFGQRPFAYTAPSGYKALCTQNLPTPTIGATSTTTANKYFDATLWTGNASTQSITNSGSMQPDLVWAKLRSTTGQHVLYDAIRGAGYALGSSNTSAESYANDSLTSFNSNGFSLGANSSNPAGAPQQNNINGNTYTYVGWQWNAGGSNATNTSGTITSTVRANTTAGFSIVTFTTPSTSTAFSVGHGLGVTPSMVIRKERGTGGLAWQVWHTSLNAGSPGNSYTLKLNTTDAQSSVANYWGTTGITQNVVGGSTAVSSNTNTTTVMYCFAAVAGYSAFGSYTGNGSTDGPFVYLGFRPRYVMMKNTSVESWYVFDSSRDPYNAVGLGLFPNLSNAETGSYPMDFLSNGFKLRVAGNPNNANTYIYAAFAESPFKYSLAR